MPRNDQRANVPGSQSNVVQIIGDDNVVTIGAQPHLTLYTAQLRKERAPLNTDIDLLVSYRCTLDLMGRDREKDSLRAWLASDAPLSIRAYTGKGGAGKTRLAMELLLTLPDGWQGGFLEPEKLAAFGPDFSAVAWKWETPMVIVVDYAATFGPNLRAWLRELSLVEDGPHPIRILLLERHAGMNMGWYSDLVDETGRTHSQRGLAAHFDPPEPYELPPLNAHDLRRRILQDTLDAYGALNNQPAPSLPEPGANADFEAKLDDTAWSDPLTLMMAAVVAAWNGLSHVLTLSRTDLAFEVGGREAGRVKRFADDAFSLLMAASVTICKGIARDKALELVNQLPHALPQLGLQLPAQAGCTDAVAFVNLLERTCGFDERENALTPVRPDIIGEAFVLHLLTRKPLRLSEELQCRLVTALVEHEPQRVVEFVLRAAQDFSHGTRPGEHDNHGEPLAWTDDLIEAAEHAEDGGQLDAIDSAMPEHTVCLQRASVRTSLALLTRLDSAPPGEARDSERARLCNNLSVELGELGRRQEALDAAQEAVDAYRVLAAQNPDAYGPDLAMSLNNLASFLSELGRRQEALDAAQEALDMRRRLAAQNPDAYGPNLAMSLNNLANRLSEAGRRQEALDAAQEAVDAYRVLAAQNPDAYGPNLAMSLNNLASFLSELGRRQEALDAAQEALDMRRRLAAQNPDAYGPDLAMSLNNLANRLSEAGRRQEALDAAQEALDAYRVLAAQNPDAYGPNLAMSLNNLASFLSELGRRQEALDAAQEALDMRRRLAAQNPDAYGPDLAMSLNNLANRLSEAGRRQEALDAAQEALDMRRRLAAQNPDAYGPDLAMSLNNLASFLSELGRRQEALAAAQEAVDMRRRLAAQNPDAYGPYLAASLNNLASFLSELGRRQEALDAAQEALDAYRVLAAQNPDAYGPNLAMSLNNLANRLSEAGRRQEAVDAAQEAVDMRRRLAAQNPDAYGPDLAMSCGTLCVVLQGLERWEEAVKAAREGIETLAPLFERQPLAFADVMKRLLQVYVQSAEEAKLEPDVALLEPIARRLQAFEEGEDGA